MLGQNWQVDVGTNAICFYKITGQTPTFGKNKNKNINYTHIYYCLLDKFIGFNFKANYKENLKIHTNAYIKYIYTVILNKQQWDPEIYLFIEKYNSERFYDNVFYRWETETRLKIWAAGIGEDF